MNTKEKAPVLPAKRLFDILLTLTILCLTAPFILLICASIKTEQLLRGRPFDPLFYSETRIGYGKAFTLYKFNIFKYEKILAMRAQGTFVHTKSLEYSGDVLYTGYVLKQIYMDELPQLLCVLRGDMSIVGPRPLNTEVYEKLMVTGVTDKNRVPAGITGYFQSFKNTAHADMVHCDRVYVDFYTTHTGLQVVWFDIKIILRTFKVILRARGV